MPTRSRSCLRDSQVSPFYIGGGFSPSPPNLTFESSPCGGGEDIKANSLFVQARLMGTCVGRGTRGLQSFPGLLGKGSSWEAGGQQRGQTGGSREAQLLGEGGRQGRWGQGLRGFTAPRWLQPEAWPAAGNLLLPLCSGLQNQLGARPRPAPHLEESSVWPGLRPLESLWLTALAILAARSTFRLWALQATPSACSALCPQPQAHRPPSGLGLADYLLRRPEPSPAVLFLSSHLAPSNTL